MCLNNNRFQTEACVNKDVIKKTAQHSEGERGIESTRTDKEGARARSLAER